MLTQQLPDAFLGRRNAMLTSHSADFSDQHQHREHIQGAKHIKHSVKYVFHVQTKNYYYFVVVRNFSLIQINQEH